MNIPRKTVTSLHHVEKLDSQTFTALNDIIDRNIKIKGYKK